MAQAFSNKHRMFWSRVAGVALLAYLVFYKPPAILPPWALEVGELLGLVLLATAAFGRIWCLVFVAGRKNNLVVAEGPYSVVRNPLYVFSFLGAVGFGLAVENPLLALVLAVGFALYYTFVVRGEEQYLTSQFGKAYQDYCDRTPRWLPDFSLYQQPETLTLPPRKIAEGILDAMWFIWAFVLWELLEVLRSMGVMPGA
jgi:protein-S-isoprenylcysteine O-methyltransferase Ste14